MLKFISLGSGSSGNCYYLNSNGFGILIDLGIGIRAFKRHFSNYGLTLAQIKAILVTHDHTDHTKAVGVLSRDFHIPVYASEKVHQSIMLNHFISKKVPLDLQHSTQLNQTFELGPFQILPFHVPHDSADNNGYIIHVENKCFVLMTDIGHFTEEMAVVVHQATHLVIESNYDVTMLANGPYPQRLKNRISGNYGHISNIETAHFLAENLNEELINRVWLCHLSAENNTPQQAYNTISRILADRKLVLPLDFKLEVLPRKTPTLLMEL